MVIDFFLFIISMYFLGYTTIGMMDYIYPNNNIKNLEKKTLAKQDDSFINGLIWADVGND